MPGKLTVIMYHYVRDIKNSRYPGIKGLETEDFKEQLKYLENHYHFVTVEQVIDSLYHDFQLPEKSVLMTFDDNYSDHYRNVFPLLETKNIQGCFFTPVEAVKDHKVLEVNKLQHVLASVPDTSDLIRYLYGCLDKHREEFSLDDNESYFKRLAVANRWDNKEVRFIKNMLQAELEKSLRNRILNSMLERYMDIDEQQFSLELYLSTDQIKTMLDGGMHFGLHGVTHSKMHLMGEEDLQNEMSRGLEFCKSIGADLSQLTISYPFGDFNDTTKQAARTIGCKLGFTIQPAITDTQNQDPLEIPRLDTNDIPKSASAGGDDWFDKG